MRLAGRVRWTAAAVASGAVLTGCGLYLQFAGDPAGAAPVSVALAAGRPTGARTGPAEAAGPSVAAVTAPAAAGAGWAPPGAASVVGAPKGSATVSAVGTAAAPPVRLRVPAIGLSSALTRLGVQPDGTLAVPQRYDVAGWFTGAPAPGSVGPAIIAGHVDSRSGPGVFVRLRQLRPGDAVYVADSRGRTLRFDVLGVEQFPKNRFPTDAVYGSVPYPALRLITCGGSFDALRGHYRDNVVVFARLHAS